MTISITRAAPLLLLALASCIIPTGPVTVTRSHRAADGFLYGKGSYAVKAEKGAAIVATSPYLAAVAREMQKVGYSESAVDPDFVAEIRVGVIASDQVETSLSVIILRRKDQMSIWDGKAVQTARKGTPAAQPGIAASKLASALFDDFPGISGETVTVP